MTTSTSTTAYTPTFVPIQPHRSLKIDAGLSTRKAHFRRLYDIYHVALQRNNITQAKRAYSILVRCREFDWASNWRSGLDMVSLPPGEDEDTNNYEDTAMDHEERARRKERRLALLKIDYLRECHIIHSRKARKSHSIREVSRNLHYLFGRSLSFYSAFTSCTSSPKLSCSRSYSYLRLSIAMLRP